MKSDEEDVISDNPTIVSQPKQVQAVFVVNKFMFKVNKKTRPRYYSEQGLVFLLLNLSK